MPSALLPTSDTPVVNFTSISILLALVTHLNLELHQLDVVTAFLNGNIDEIIYMEPPEGFILSDNANKKCLLMKGLYGLKQANRQWHSKMDTFLCDELGFYRTAADCCLYVRRKRGNISLIALYVDDLLIACSYKAVLDEIKIMLSKEFDMEDMAEAKKVLELEIRRDKTHRKLALSQVSGIFQIHPNKVRNERCTWGDLPHGHKCQPIWRM
jgi:hypothetical protein